LVAEGEVDAVLDGATVLTTGEVDSRLLAAVNQARAEVELAGRAARLSLTSQEVADLFAPLPPVDVRNLERAEATGGQVGVATIAVVGLFLALTVYGGAVLNGVLTEKSSRVVEVLLASVQPQALLAGKVAGIGALGLLQVAAQAAVALAVLYSAGSVDLPSGTAATVVLAVVFFVLGFLLFSTFYATAGALVSRQEDAQAAATPVALLMTAAYIATIVVVLPAPSSVAARVLTFVPLTAPTTVLARTALSAIAWWEVALAAAVVVVASLGMIRVAARAYSGAVLSFGGRVKLREALRAGR
jgi:ABC-2 type transport system permease protein